MTTDRSRPVTSSRGDVVWVLVAVLALAVIGVKVGNLFDLHLPWLYAVAAGANVGIAINVCQETFQLAEHLRADRIQFGWSVQR